MRYTYKCDDCGLELAVSHGMNDEPDVLCSDCMCAMRKKIEPPAHIITSTIGGRSILKRDRPSNREYQAYRRWEDAGGEPDAPERNAYIEERGYE